MVDAAALLVDEALPHRPIRQWVLNVPFALRFLFARQCEGLSAALGIVNRAISAHLIAKAGLNRAQARTGAVTLIQRFGGALNLNIHFHGLVLDGIYVRRPGGGVGFVAVPAPAASELQELVSRISERDGRHLERLCRYVARSAIADSRLFHRPGPGALRGQDALAQRHHACPVRAAGFYRPTGGPDSPAWRQSFAIPWGAGTQQLLSPAGHAGPARQATGRRDDSDRTREASRYDLGTASQALVQEGGEVCEYCSGAVKIIACIERTDVIDRILAENSVLAERPQAARAASCRAAVVGTIPS